MSKFKIRKVSRFRYKGKDYVPGDIVELPKRFEGLDFLERVKQEPKKLVEPKSEKSEKPRE